MIFLSDELNELGDKVPQASLDELCENEQLQQLLHNRHLRDYLIKLNSSENPARDMEKAMREPLFLEFADECLKVVEPNTDDENR